jgi:diadenylate cyclase
LDQLHDLVTYLRAIRLVDVVDILLVAAVFYGLLYMVRGTRAVQLLRGILVLVLGVFLLSQVARLAAFSWLLAAVLPALLVAVPVIFQPELRRALEQLGRAGVFLYRTGVDPAADSVVTVVALAARRLSEQRFGALIVLERTTALGDLAERGTRLDAVTSVDLLSQIFVKNGPLHDGAVIIRDGRVAAAGVVLPLGELLPQHAAERGLGTRHLAALHVTELTDALAVVVSEETGTISLARDGNLIRHLDEGELARHLYRWYANPHRSQAQRIGSLLGLGALNNDKGRQAQESERGVE